MLLPHAVLALQNKKTHKYIAIPVRNFPMMPLGSKVKIHFGEELTLDDTFISQYIANNKCGTEVELEFGASMRDVFLWNQAAALCKKDPNLYYDLLYPDTIDFGAKFSLR